MRSVCLSFLIVSLIASSACTSTYYKAMAKFGKEKRDILVSRVKDSKKDQEAAKEQIKTTMESFQELTNFNGGDLERNYKKLNGELEKADDRAKQIHNRIASITQVSNDLFAEWQKEIDEMGNADLKSKSAAMLRDSRTKQTTYIQALQKTELRMTPVLHAFRDQVLFLKHNLNARAIGSLKGTAAKMDVEVTGAITQLDASIKEADKLIDALSAPDSAT